jgi:hypothetical protein
MISFLILILGIVLDQIMILKHAPQSSFCIAYSKPHNFSVDTHTITFLIQVVITCCLN